LVDSNRHLLYLAPGAGVDEEGIPEDDIELLALHPALGQEEEENSSIETYRPCCCELPRWSTPIVTYFILLPFVYMISHKLMYPGDPWNPKDFWSYCLRCEAFTFPSSQGGSIQAIRLPPYGNVSLAVPVVVLGGNSMNMYHSISSDSLPQLLPPDETWDVYSVSYPGYQYAPWAGWMTEALCIQDIRDLLAFVRKKTGKSVVLMGWSLGTAIVAGAAAAAPGDVRCMVLGNAFTNMWSMGIHFSQGLVAPWIYIIDSWRTEGRLSEGWARNVPLVVMSGTKDKLIPAWMHTAVYKAAASTFKRLLESPSSHNDIGAFAGQPLTELLREWCVDT